MPPSPDLGRRAGALAAAAALAAALGGCVPQGATMFPNGGPLPGIDGGTPPPVDSSVPGDVAILTLVLDLEDIVEVCQVTITVVTQAGPFMFSEPAIPSCPLVFPRTRELPFTAAELGGMESMVTVTAIGRDADSSVSAQGSAAITMIIGFATDLSLGLEAF